MSPINFFLFSCIYPQLREYSMSIFPPRKNFTPVITYHPRIPFWISLKIEHMVFSCFQHPVLKFSSSESLYKKIYSKNSKMTCLEQRNPRIQSFDTKCYETSSKNRIKEISTPYKSTTLMGRPPLHYINEKLLHDAKYKTSFLYIGVHGATM